jgi:serine phosphatase RsbU (regulator of sigma subunit)
VLAAGWTAVVCALLVWSLLGEWREAVDVAREGAVAAFERDVVYRRWNAQHNGVYVAVTKDTPPNPYLRDVPERDITTPSGRVLTLVNPAYMNRQAYELSKGEEVAHGHLTSLNPINPKNVPDPWEAQALRSIAAGKKEVYQPVEIHGKRHLRLMRPLVTESSCLACHAVQGYKVGDIRGGISAVVAMAPYEAIARARILDISLGYGGLWLVGLAGISLGSHRLRRRIQAEAGKQREQEIYLRLAHEIQRRFYSTTASLPGFDLAGAAVSAAYTGGDYFDFIQCPDGCLLIVIGDVSGHGFGAALVMAETRAYVRSGANGESDLGSLLSGVSRKLAADLDGSQYVTLLLVRLDPGNRSLQFAGAGHVPCYLLSPSGEVSSVLDSSGPPAGLFPEFEFTASQSMSLKDGETLLLLTDGVTEAANPGEIEFGAERALEFLRCHPHSTAAELVRGICEAVREFAGDRPQRDDITCVACRMSPAA